MSRNSGRRGGNKKIHGQHVDRYQRLAPDQAEVQRYLKSAKPAPAPKEETDLEEAS